MKSKTLISLILLTSTVLLSACDNPSAANAENKEYKDIVFHICKGNEEARFEPHDYTVNVAIGDTLTNKMVEDPYIGTDLYGTYGGLYDQSYPVGYYLDEAKTRKVKASELIEYDGSFTEIWAVFINFPFLDAHYIFPEGTYHTCKKDNSFEFKDGSFSVEIEGHTFEFENLQNEIKSVKKLYFESFKADGEEYVSSRNRAQISFLNYVYYEDYDNPAGRHDICYLSFLLSAVPEYIAYSLGEDDMEEYNNYVFVGPNTYSIYFDL